MTREEWEAIKNRDRRYDGRFFYALKTTKSVCRPSCPARMCNPKNVIIFPTYEEAVSKGFRPCKRCRPDQMGWSGAKAELAESAKKLIEERYTEKFSLDVIAGALFVNGSYLIRAFRESTGVTPLHYHNQVRCEKAKEMLTHSEFSISFISSMVGFSSSSHFTRVFKGIVGCTPSQYRTAYFASLV